MNLAVFVILAIAFAMPSPFAAAQGWFGTWKLDRAHSHLQGPTITIVRVPGGYHFEFGATSFTIGDDGKDYPTVPTRSTSLKQTGGRSWFRVHKINGREVDHSTLTISPDDKTLLIHTTATDVAGVEHSSDDKEERIGEGDGLAGTWRSTVAGINVSEEITLSDAGQGRIRWDLPREEQFYIALPNGVAVPLQGRHSVPGVTVSVWKQSATAMHWTVFVDGRAYTNGEDVLSADRKTLSETTWPAANTQEKQRAVYRRERSF